MTSWLYRLLVARTQFSSKVGKVGVFRLWVTAVPLQAPARHVKLSNTLERHLVFLIATLSKLLESSLLVSFIILYHTTPRPYVRSKGRKFERARGRRKSRGYKN